jgi:hypothetical protein
VQGFGRGAFLFGDELLDFVEFGGHLERFYSSCSVVESSKVSAIRTLLLCYFYFAVQMLLDPQGNLEVEEVGAASNLASAAPAFLPASDFRPGIHASRVFDIKVQLTSEHEGRAYLSVSL